MVIKLLAFNLLQVLKKVVCLVFPDCLWPYSLNSPPSPRYVCVSQNVHHVSGSTEQEAEGIITPVPITDSFRNDAQLIVA